MTRVAASPTCPCVLLVLVSRLQLQLPRRSTESVRLCIRHSARIPAVLPDLHALEQPGGPPFSAIPVRTEMDIATECRRLVAHYLEANGRLAEWFC